MTKMKYQKPKMEVYEVIKTNILQTTSPPGGTGDSVYTPRINEDLNEMA